MTHLLTQFAETSSGGGDLFTSLGIDWKTLIIQIVAFLILVALLGKFVYPWLMKSVDTRQEAIESAAKAAQAAQESAEKSQDSIEKLLKEARSEADGILETAKLEAANALSSSEEKARKRTEQILADARDEINKDIIAAKKALHNETLSLVALATEKVLGKTLTKDIDQKVIAQSLQETK